MTAGGVVTEPEELGPFLSKSNALTYLQKRGHNGQGIICECCHHQCQLRELMEYCSDDSSKRKRSYSTIVNHLNPIVASSSSKRSQDQNQDDRDYFDRGFFK